MYQIAARALKEIGLDVTAYSDEALADALLTVAPVVDDDWPSDEQLRHALELLAEGAR